jgi:hypothetical protein
MPCSAHSSSQERGLEVAHIKPEATSSLSGLIEIAMGGDRGTQQLRRRP